MTEKQEVVALMTELRGKTHARFLGIERDGKGRFRGFTEAAIPAPDSVEGRFANLLPPHQPTPHEMKVAKQVLSLLGVSADGDKRWPNLN